MQQSKVL
jgi:hypothetical protein